MVRKAPPAALGSAPVPSSPAAPPRGRGRPRGDAPDLRASLLDAALASYVRHGIAGATLRHIAAEGGVTPALLHYYFTDAAGLREAVIAERLMPVFTDIRDTLLGMPDASLREVLTAFVDGICATIARHPWLPPLWIREVVSEGGSLRDLLVTRLAPQIATVLADRFAQEQAAGRLNPALDPRLLMVSLVGLTLFPAAGTPIWRQIFASDELGIEDIRRHALALIERGLELPA
ncbi:TetR/AcrR family transcriptional regulator [Luteimonas kalidii]|uniref:TetR/AcrR family transcriptional regulator n=1 Tax=Luteimonas kalidii TaxID=3042025 RepID=A0ABT6JXT0_9GAMM|nr:TetR/AcrR family transcriptional regulator [Luteimonas kalidii]MDH5835505.1 TetR/AcrR family transcriptional regulator [Luteimonas kalidii]